MTPFVCLSSVALTVMEDNIDTDIIFPARFLLIMEKEGLGRYLFHDRRHTGDGTPIAGSWLDRPETKGAGILIAGANFGCGSSREHAVWALAGFGVRCVIAPSFGEIFFANCFNSGVLPITLPPEVVADLARRAIAGGVFDIDLEAGRITDDRGAIFPFTIEAGRRLALLQGRDTIDTILHEDLGAIERFEDGHRTLQPWLFD